MKMNLIYRENLYCSAKQIANLREAVGWPRMESYYSNSHMASFYHIACYDGEELVGYVDSVSNGLTDAYIQDLMIYPNYQCKGIGTELMNRMIAGLKERKIFMISCIYGIPDLAKFYKRFGFFQMLCGQMQMYEVE